MATHGDSIVLGRNAKTDLRRAMGQNWTGNPLALKSLILSILFWGVQVSPIHIAIA